MKVAIYARTSTTDQSCDMQLTELREYVTSRKWTLVKEYVDFGFSGADTNRPNCKQCVLDAGKRMFDTILVWKIDRWGRTLNQLSNDIMQFDSMGIRFIAVTQNIDTDKSNPTSRLLLHIMSAMAEFERELILERVKSGMANAKLHGTRSGKAIGRPKVIFDRGKALELRSQGKSYGTIARILDIPKSTIKRVCDAS